MIRKAYNKPGRVRPPRTKTPRPPTPPPSGGGGTRLLGCKSAALTVAVPALTLLAACTALTTGAIR